MLCLFISCLMSTHNLRKATVIKSDKILSHIKIDFAYMKAVELFLFKYFCESGISTINPETG